MLLYAIAGGDFEEAWIAAALRMAIEGLARSRPCRKPPCASANPGVRHDRFRSACPARPSKGHFDPAISRQIGQSSLEIWPDHAFDIAFNYRKWMGIELALVNNPEGIRHVLLTNAANYRRPAGVRRVALPLGGNGLFLAEGADWRRQRRIMAPPFTPASIALLLPHFHEAAAHLLRSVSNKRDNLSAAFQDTALEAVLRALFSLPESPLRREIAQMARHYIIGSFLIFQAWRSLGIQISKFEY